MLQRRRGMRRVRGGWLAIAMAVGACGFPKLPQLDDSDPQSDGGVPGGDGGMPGDGGLDGPDTGELSLVLLAGSIGGAGNLDGQGTAARLTSPQAMCLDPMGNLYVLDSQTIRKITSTGMVSTLAGRWNSPGSIDGPGALAKFGNPSGLAADSNGNLYVADTDNHTIRRVTPQGLVSTVAGLVSVFGSSDGAGASARFRSPEGITFSENNEAFVTDTGNHTIRKITSSGVVTTLAGSAGTSGAVDGEGAAARFFEPRGIAVDMNGNLAVADVRNYTVRRVVAASQSVSTLAGTAGLQGMADGPGNAATFFIPSHVTADGASGFYVAEPGAHKVRRLTPAGEVTTMVLPPEWQSLAPMGLAARTGDLYVSSSYYNVVLRWRTNGAIETFAGSRVSYGYAEGAGAAALFGSQAAVATLGANVILVADTNSEVIRKLATDGTTSLWAGAPNVRGASDGPRLEARFEYPAALARSSRGDVYVADKCAIRKIDALGEVTTFAGVSTVCSTVDGIGPDARFESISALAVDASGTVYVAQRSQHILRKVTAQGEVSTFAGMYGSSGRIDGTGSSARFLNPTDLALDSAGNLYVADTSNHAIRKVTPAGVVTTLAGGSFGFVDATGPLARFLNPSALTVDAAGNVYVADTGNHAIRKVTAAGVVTTIAGSPASIGIRLGTSPSFANPSRIALLGDSLLIVDGPSVIALRHGAR